MTMDGEAKVWRISRRWSAPAAVAVIAVIWSATFGQEADIEATADREATRHAESVARSFESFVDVNVALIDNQMKFIARALRQHGVERTAVMVGDTLAVDDLFTEVGLFGRGEQGLVVGRNGVGAGDRPLEFESQGDALVIGRPMASRAGGGWVIPFLRAAAPIAGDNTVGVSVGVEPQSFSRFYAPALLGPNGVIVLVGAQDHIVRARGAATPQEVGEDVSVSGLWAAVAAAPVGTYWQVSAVDGVRRIYAYRRLDRYPLVVVAGVAAEDIRAQTAIQRAHLRLAAGGGTALTLLVLFSWTQLRRSHDRLEAEVARRTKELTAELAAQAGREAELREARRLAEAASHAKSDFLANTSHELRTPLNAVIGFSEAILSEIFGPLTPKVREYVGDICRSGQHLLRVINDILDISAIEAGHLQLSEESVDLVGLLTECARLIEPRALREGVALSVQPGLLPQVTADCRRLKQVVLNLLSNAVKFTPTGGRVEVSARQDESGGIAMIFADTGIGMDAAGIVQALKPFGQVESRLNRRFEGLGLGLPLSCRIVEQHGGQLIIASRPGQGTTVTVLLPPARVTGRS